MGYGHQMRPAFRAFGLFFHVPDSFFYRIVVAVHASQPHPGAEKAALERVLYLLGRQGGLHDFRKLMNKAEFAKMREPLFQDELYLAFLYLYYLLFRLGNIHFFQKKFVHGFLVYGRIGIS